MVVASITIVTYTRLGVQGWVHSINARLSSCVSLQHGSDTWSAVVIEGTERLDRLQTGRQEACPEREIRPQCS